MEKRLPGPPNLTCIINVGVNDSADQSTPSDWSSDRLVRGTARLDGLDQ
jgi:hypothetical protein